MAARYGSRRCRRPDRERGPRAAATAYRRGLSAATTGRPHGHLIRLCGYALWRRAHGAIARVVAFAIACIVLANPLIVRERRAPLPDIVALVVDHSASMNLDHRRADADRAAAAMARQIAADRTLEIR